MALRRVFAGAAAAFIAFAVWGSLFPFIFRPAPAATILARFWSPWHAGALAWSLTDLASNVMLFIPIGLFATAALARARRSGPGATAPLRHGLPATRAAWAVLLVTLVLSTALEVAQAYVPWRTPSVVDVFAETMGAAVGIVLWRFAGPELDALMGLAHGALRVSSRAERWLLSYGAAFAVWWLLPLDFTVRPDEIADKYAHQRLLLPFTPSPDAATTGDLGFALIAAIPIGIVAAGWRCPAGKCWSIPRIAVVAVPAGLALEAAQALVFSRNTDGTALLAVLAGVFAGALAARLWRRSAVVPLRMPMSLRWVPVLGCVAAMVLCGWWPFDFDVDPAASARAMNAWSRAPFRTPASTFGLLACMSVAFAGGLAVGARLWSGFVRLQMIATMAIGGGLFAAIETGRLLLEGGRPTLLSVCLELTALLAGLHAGASRAPHLSTRRAD